MGSKGFVYKLCIKDGSLDDCYIGSTTNIKVRKNTHKCNCNNKNRPAYNFKVYRFIRDNGGFDNWTIHRLEQVEFIDKIDLYKRERYWIETLKPSLNSQLPNRTKKEYNEKNKEKMKEYNKKYHKENKDYLIQKAKEYYEQNKDNKKEYDKIYREDNKNKIKEYNKKYYKEKMSQKVKCDCGILISRHSLYLHKKSQKHINNL